jgi:uncharacterized membrane protein
LFCAAVSLCSTCSLLGTIIMQMYLDDWVPKMGPLVFWVDIVIHVIPLIMAPLSWVLYKDSKTGHISWKKSFLFMILFGTLYLMEHSPAQVYSPSRWSNTRLVSLASLTCLSFLTIFSR